MHDVTESIGSEVSVILPTLHDMKQAVTLQAHGKSIALKAFYDDLEHTLENGQLLGNDPSVLSASAVLAFIKCLSYLYTGKEEYCSISLTRKELFCKKQLRNEKLSQTETRVFEAS